MKSVFFFLLAQFQGLASERSDAPPPPWDLFDDCCASNTSAAACSMYSRECNPCINQPSCCTGDDDTYECRKKATKCLELNDWIDEWCDSDYWIPPLDAPPWN